MESCFILAALSILILAYGVERKRLIPILLSMLVTLTAMISAAWSNSASANAYFGLTIKLLTLIMLVQAATALWGATQLYRQSRE